MKLSMKGFPNLPSNILQSVSPAPAVQGLILDGEILQETFSKMAKLSLGCSHNCTDLSEMENTLGN